MSENQLSPLHTNPVPPQPATADPVDLQIQQESQADPTESQNGIERRQILSPVSPHPVHVQEPPVLKNQMELANSFTDAHPPTNSSVTGPSSAAVVSPDLSSLQSLIQQHQQQQQQQQQQNIQHGQLSSTIQSAPQHHQHPEATTYASSSLPAAAPFPAMDNSTVASSSFSHAGNGEVPAGNGSFESSASSASSNGTAPSKPTNISTNGPPQPPAPTTTTLPNNMSSSNVDLQALLTKLSSPATPTAPQQLHSAPQSPPLPNGAPVVAPSSSAPPPSVKTPLPESPVQKTRTSSNPPPAPTNHPLPPVPVVSSSLPGQPPAGYPSSLPLPPNFAQHKQQQAASVTEEEDEEDARPFTVDEEEAFSQFLTDERDYVSQGQWDRFPPGSRLFIGAHPPVLPPLID
jgi:nuclear polyadenylated RNA-binding protein 3